MCAKKPRQGQPPGPEALIADIFCHREAYVGRIGRSIQWLERRMDRRDLLQHMTITLMLITMHSAVLVFREKDFQWHSAPES